MKYLDSNGLQKLRDADSERMNRLYRPIECGLWTKSESGQNVSIYPVGGIKVNPTVEFRFKETPPASGTKSPSNPSTISGWTSVNAGRVGKNLLLKMASLTGGEPYVTITGNADGSYTFNGSNTSGNILYIPITDCGNVFNTNQPIKSSVVLDSSRQYTLSMEFLSGTYTAEINKNSTHTFGYSGNSGEYTLCAFPRSGKTCFTIQSIPQADGRFIARVNIAADSSFDNATFRFQLEEGPIPTSFEMPLTSSEANHAISLGNTYYGGSIDVSTGLMTVTYEMVQPKRNYIASTNAVEHMEGNIWQVIVADLREGSGGRPCQTFGYQNSAGYVGENYFCNYYDWDRSGKSISFHCSINFAFIGIEGSSAEDARQNLLAVYDAAVAAGKPIIIGYPVETPYTVQLTPVQISSLFQNDRYSPRKNTFYTDASNSISVEYLKSPVKASYDIQQAILAQGGV